MHKAGLPSHWDNAQFRQVCLKTESVDPGKNPDQLFTYIDVSSVSNESFTIQETKTLLGKGAPSRARKLIRSDDIIFATVRPTLRRIAQVPAWLDGQICSTGYCVVRPDSYRLLSAYAYFYLLTDEVTRHVEAMQKGATYPAISDDDLLGLSIPLPPLPEQRAIARVLRDVQAAREARQREVALERERKAALMAHLFTHGTRGEPTKQTPIGEMPVSWEVKALGELVRQSITDGVHQTPQYVTEGIPFVTAKDIVDNHIDFSHSARITADAHKILTQRVRPEAGDVLLTKVGTVGNVALVDGGQEFSIFVQVALIKPSPDQVSGDFLFHAMQSEAVQIEIAQRSALSTMRFIGTQKIASVRVPVPRPEEQRSVAEVLHACDAKIAALERESVLLDELFRALLEALMTGRVSVAGVLDHETAKDREGAKHEAREARLAARHSEPRS